MKFYISLHLVLFCTFYTSLAFKIGQDGLTTHNFEFIELNDAHLAGDKILSYNAAEVKDVYIRESDTEITFYKVERDESRNTIDVKLVHDLSDYFMTRWESNFEITVEVIYPAQASEEFTFLTLIEDVNNHGPEFLIDSIKSPGDGAASIDLHITPSWPHHVPIHKSLIQLVDYDFEERNANVHLSCEGVSTDVCNFFNLTKKCDEKKIRDEPGYFFTLGIYLAQGIESEDIVGKSFSFYMVANDEIHTTKKLITVQVGNEGIPAEGDDDFPVELLAAIGGVLFAIVVVISSFLALSIIKNRSTKKILDKLTHEEIREFREGAAVPRRGSVDFNGTIATLPFKTDYEIPRENLQINETCILGSGAFGIVYKGSVLMEDAMLEVAVKMLKKNMTVQYFKALMDELKIMAYIGKHPNVVRLIGSCSKNIKKLELYVAVEYCMHGNIRDFLKYRKSSFANMVVDGVLTPPTFIGNLVRQNSFSKTVSTMDLIGWSQQIANGMDYLSSKQVIHGDLAARNILIDGDRTAKISDFGLSRRQVDYTIYSTTSKNTPLPLRWMAPESLKFKKFSTKSDTWSFGILLWEIFALGQTPYPGVPSDDKFVDKLDAGLRMSRPENATNEIYDIMRKCWDNFEYNRPAFLEIKSCLQGMQSKFLAQQGEGYMTLGYMSGLNSYSYSNRSGLVRPNRRLTSMSLFKVPEVAIEEDTENGSSSTPYRHTFS